MNELDKKNVIDVWKKHQLSILVLRGSITDLVSVAEALGEIKTKEERESFEKLESLISEALEEIDAIKDRFWKASAEALLAAKN